MIPQNVIDYENARWWEFLHTIYVLVCLLPFAGLVLGIVWLMQRPNRDEDDN